MCIDYSGEIPAYSSAKTGPRYHTQSLAKFLLQSCSSLSVDTTREERGAALLPASLRRVLQLCCGEGQELTTLSGRSLIIWLMYLVNGHGAAALTSCTLHKLQPFPWACRHRARGAGGIAEHEPEALRGHRCLSTAPDLLPMPQATRFRWNDHRSPSPVPRGRSNAAPQHLLVFALSFLCTGLPQGLASGKYSPGPHRATCVRRNASVHIPSLASEAVEQMGKQSKKTTEFSQNASAPSGIYRAAQGEAAQHPRHRHFVFLRKRPRCSAPGQHHACSLLSTLSPTRICSQTHLFTAPHKSTAAFAL